MSSKQRNGQEEEKAELFDDDIGFETRTAEKWVNKQRTYIAMSRNIKKNEKQFAKNFSRLLCHTKTDSKVEKKDVVAQLSEVCRVRNCTNVLFFEQKRDQLYLWAGKWPNGPTVKLLVGDVVSAESQKFLGNCLKSSRPLFSFDAAFNNGVLALVRNLLIDALNIPNHHPGAQPFFDKLFAFGAEGADHSKLVFRNYQIGRSGARKESTELVEIGPRCSFRLVKIFEGFLTGKVIFSDTKEKSARSIKRAKEEVLRKKIEKKGERKVVREEKKSIRSKKQGKELMDYFYE